MGKGDQKTRRGKVNRASYGKTRPHKKKHEMHGSRTQAPKSSPKAGATRVTPAS